LPEKFSEKEAGRGGNDVGEISAKAILGQYDGVDDGEGFEATAGGDYPWIK
jgi:hypothetical protein